MPIGHRHAVTGNFACNIAYAYSFNSMITFSCVVDIATLLGLGATIWGLCRTAKASRVAREAAERTERRVKTTYGLPLITNLIQYAYFAQKESHISDYGAAKIRLQLVKEGLYSFSGSSYISNEKFHETIRVLDSCLRALEQEWSIPGTIRLTSFNGEIESVITCMMEIKSKIVNSKE